MHKGPPGTGKMIYKTKKCKKYIDREVDDSKIFVLQRTYRRHKKEEDFHNTICRIKHWKSNKYERFFLVLNDWAGGKEKPYSSLSKPCHGNASTENAKKLPFARTDKKTSALLKKKLAEGHRSTFVYEMGIETSGGSLKSTSQSPQPGNPKQVCKS